MRYLSEWNFKRLWWYVGFFRRAHLRPGLRGVAKICNLLDGCAKNGRGGRLRRGPCPRRTRAECGRLSPAALCVSARAPPPPNWMSSLRLAPGALQVRTRACPAAAGTARTGSGDSERQIPRPGPGLLAPLPHGHAPRWCGLRVASCTLMPGRTLRAADILMAPHAAAWCESLFAWDRPSLP